MVLFVLFDWMVVMCSPRQLTDHKKKGSEGGGGGEKPYLRILETFLPRTSNKHLTGKLMFHHVNKGYALEGNMFEY